MSNMFAIQYRKAVSVPIIPMVTSTADSRHNSPRCALVYRVVNEVFLTPYINSGLRLELIK